MKLCSGQCRYLLAVSELAKTKKVVRSVDIANKIGVTRSSVSRMLKCMERLELINPDYSLSVELTPLGTETAKSLSVSFEAVHSFFSEILRLSETEAYEQAIQFIASFPETTVEKLSQITKNTLNKRKNNKKSE